MYQKLGICALSLSLLGTVYTPNAGAESVAPTVKSLSILNRM